MPLRLNSIINHDPDHAVFSWIVQGGMDKCNSVFVTEDKSYLHGRCEIHDSASGEALGKIIYTLKVGDKMMEILDLDITLNNDTPTRVRFNKRYKESSDSNEYFEAETVGSDQHFKLETVNRHAIKDGLEGSERDVSISVFPYELSVFESIDAFNSWVGITKEIKIGDTDIAVGGYSEKFIMPEGIFDSEEEYEEHYSLLLGTVVSYKDVQVDFGENTVSFVIARVDTALGTVPVAMGREVFDLSSLKEGSLVAMNANVKADLAKDEMFQYASK